MKKSQKKQKLKRFVVETTSNFHEVHVVYAKDEEEAKFIAQQADYNSSNWLGQQFIGVFDATNEKIAEYEARDEYFFRGASKIDEEGYLIYTNYDGKQVNQNMRKEKVR